MRNVAQVSTTIQAGVETIWRALTTPETIKQYFFGSDVECDFRGGRSIVFRGEHQGKAYEDKGEILEVEYVWGSHKGRPRAKGTVREELVNRSRGIEEDSRGRKRCS